MGRAKAAVGVAGRVSGVLGTSSSSLMAGRAGGLMVTALGLVPVLQAFSTALAKSTLGEPFSPPASTLVSIWSKGMVGFSCNRKCILDFLEF